MQLAPRHNTICLTPACAWNFSPSSPLFNLHSSSGTSAGYFHCIRQLSFHASHLWHHPRRLPISHVKVFFRSLAATHAFLPPMLPTLKVLVHTPLPLPNSPFSLPILSGVTPLSLPIIIISYKLPLHRISWLYGSFHPYVRLLVFFHFVDMNNVSLVYSLVALPLSILN